MNEIKLLLGRNTLTAYKIGARGYNAWQLLRSGQKSLSTDSNTGPDRRRNSQPDL